MQLSRFGVTLGLLLAGCTEYGINEEKKPVDTGTPQETATPAETSEPQDSAETAETAETADTSAPEELCNGTDDDGDGLVDEDYGDTDGDGIADCVDVEDCDGIDNDGDGLVDESWADTDSDGTADCVDVEDCDGRDNDGDGQVDEGFDADGDGTADCLESSYDVTLVLSADDEWEGWVDGASIGGEAGWSTADTVSLSWDSGSHAVAIHAWDTGAAISGFIASLTVSGVGTWVTGSADWLATTSSPSGSWSVAGYDDSAWSTPLPCPSSEVSSYWGGEPSSIVATGAQWIWVRDCIGLGEGWFRLEVDLP